VTYIRGRQTPKLSNAFEVEVENDEDVIDNGGEGYGSLNVPCPYSEEPIASKSWKDDYTKRKEATVELKRKLSDRLDGKTLISEW